MTGEPASIGTAVTDDRFLSGRVMVRQPAQGYRAAIDPVILAAAVPAVAGEVALELGAGVGTASLCLLARQPGLAVTALEVHPELAALARENGIGNALEDRFRVVEGDILAIPPALAPGTFDHVFLNPPYLVRGEGRAAASGWGRIATEEGEAVLEDWIATAVKMAGPKGTITVIHRADSLPRLLSALHQQAGEIALAPLWPTPGRAAKRIVVRARKSSKAPARVVPGLVLHGDDGRFSSAAEAILRDGEAFDF